MGITVHQSPTGYTSAHGEVWHVVESTDKNLQGFKYVYDIYKGNTLLTRIKNSPLGDDLLVRYRDWETQYRDWETDRKSVV